jgi:hypothetical protein
VVQRLQGPHFINVDLEVWNRAQSRVFNIGYEGCGFVVPVVERPVGSGCWYARDPDSPTHCETSLSPALLQAVARVGGTVTTTIYPATKQVRPRAP